MINNIKKTTETSQVKEKSINYDRLSSNATTGDKEHLYPKLKQSFKTATSIDIIVSFLMESGVKLLLQDLKEALNRGVKIRILTGIGFHAFFGSLLDQPVRNILTGMEYTGTAVVCLFLMF